MGKKQKKMKALYGWRTERQTVEMMRITEYTALAVSIAGFAAAVLYGLRGSALWLLASVALLVLTIVLDILFPAYFTLIPPEKGERKPAHGLYEAWCAAGVVLLITTSSWNLVETGSLWLLGAACGIVTAVVLGLWAEEFRREKYLLVVAFLVGGLIGGLFLGHCNVVFDNKPAEVYTLEVENLRSHRSRRSAGYYCSVTMPDGTEKELQITVDTWNHLEEGSMVQVRVGQGALGVGYVVASPTE